MKDVPALVPGHSRSCAVPPRADARDVLVSRARRARGAAAGRRGSGRRASAGARSSGAPARPRRDAAPRQRRHAPRSAGAPATSTRSCSPPRASRGSASTEPAARPLPTDVLLPAVGQGALALECRAGDAATRARCSPALDRPAVGGGRGRGARLPSRHRRRLQHAARRACDRHGRSPGASRAGERPRRHAAARGRDRRGRRGRGQARPRRSPTASSRGAPGRSDRAMKAKRGRPRLSGRCRTGRSRAPHAPRAALPRAGGRRRARRPRELAGSWSTRGRTPRSSTSAGRTAAPGGSRRRRSRTLLIARARDGRTVVRLKSGDPFLFGRGGEEAQALRRGRHPVRGRARRDVGDRGARVRRHPGHRPRPRVARDVHHRPPRGDRPGRRSAAAPVGAARPPGRDARLPHGGEAPARHRARRWSRHGLAAATRPAAVIERGTLGSQRTIVATIATIAAEARRGGRRARRRVVVVGATVGLRERVAWFERRPLLGRRVVVTRPRAQAGELAARARGRSAPRSMLVPTIEIAPPPDPAALDRAVQAAGTLRLDRLHERERRARLLRAHGRARRRRRERSHRVTHRRDRTGDRGRARAAARCARRWCRPSIAPKGCSTRSARSDLRGRRVLLPRAAGARAILPDDAARARRDVDEVIAYAAVAPSDAGRGRAARTRSPAGAIDARHVHVELDRAELRGARRRRRASRRSRAAAARSSRASVP